MAITLYWEDMQPGQVRELGTTSASADEIKEFAAKYDPQPFHLDEEAAKATFFKGLAASGWHTMAMTMKLMVEGGCPVAGGIIGAGGEISWPQPTRPGDVLQGLERLAARHGRRFEPCAELRRRAAQGEPFRRPLPEGV